MFKLPNCFAVGHKLLFQQKNCCIFMYFTKKGASEQKAEMEILTKQAAEESKKLEKRKKEIDIELSEIEPLVREAKAAVGGKK